MSCDGLSARRFGGRGGALSRTRPRASRAVTLLLLATVVWAAGCSRPGRMPDVVGESVDDSVERLRESGFDDILIFSSDVHAARPWEVTVDGDATVTMTHPEPGEEASGTARLWYGEKPDLPSDVPPDSWYYSHRERIEEYGTDVCLPCHDRTTCTECHEDRLQRTAALLREDPAEAQALSAVVADALGVSVDEVLALDRGDGWYRIEVAYSGPTDASETTARGREMALLAVPAVFESEPGARTVVVALVRGDEVLMEIGFEHRTYEALDWSAADADDLPWVADRYAVPSG